MELLNRWMIQVRTQITNLQNLPAPLRDSFFILLGAHLLTEAPSILTDLYPGWSRQIIDPFLKPGFHLADPLPLNWYLKYMLDDVFIIMVFYCFAKICLMISTIFFVIALIYLGYHLLDLCMYFWDFKNTHVFYWDMLFTAMVLTKGAIKGYKPSTIAKIRSLF